MLLKRGFVEKIGPASKSIPRYKEEDIKAVDKIVGGIAGYHDARILKAFEYIDDKEERQYAIVDEIIIVYAKLDAANQFLWPVAPPCPPYCGGGAGLSSRSSARTSATSDILGRLDDIITFIDREIKEVSNDTDNDNEIKLDYLLGSIKSAKSQVETVKKLVENMRESLMRIL